MEIEAFAIVNAGCGVVNPCRYDAIGFE